MAQRSVPAPFLTKTYQLVEDPGSDEVVSWNEEGTAFVVWKTADFAKDLLPKYFKHNNFSSFVRQLNTYGFRKIVPDKWEFANENFKRGEKDLLSQIRRRKTTPPTRSPATAKACANASSSPSNSGEDLGSTSTSSPVPKGQGPMAVETQVVMTQLADLSDENKKLKTDNEKLNSELTQTKKQCDELTNFLTEYLKVGPDQISRIMGQGQLGSTSDTAVDNNNDDDESDGVVEANKGGEEERLKLFGVWLNKKRVRGKEKTGFNELRAKAMRVDFKASLVESGKVCN
ncbi:hypothetical protein MLD38_009243 [Melastoma candidum]|uniref:Uncharacterized protein n=1 Tax=Melastoma candidum TaxID=119954 RepID=A0ACB9RW33_9MYRT|nr:hypothetical protein MLD38_009243 [Melastoma candidum]